MSDALLYKLFLEPEREVDFDRKKIEGHAEPFLQLVDALALKC